MPTYDYKCDNCGHSFDVFQSMKDDKLTKCPNCGENTLKRLIGTGSGLIFKGSGFYLTDYKNKPTESSSSVSKTEGSPKKETTETNSADTTKTETKTKTTTTTTQESSAKKPEKKSSEVKAEKEK